MFNLAHRREKFPQRILRYCHFSKNSLDVKFVAHLKQNCNIGDGAGYANKPTPWVVGRKRADVVIRPYNGWVRINAKAFPLGVSLSGGQ